MNSPAPADGHESPVTSSITRPGWWFQVVRVRLRFLLIVAFAGIVVSQWPLVRNVWDRWTWSGVHRHETGSVSTSHEYFCPMDQGVISVWPAICPICNMDLVRRKKMDAVMLPEGVVARMQLSPYRIQLAGIRTAVVEPRPLTFEQVFTGVLRRADDGSMGFDAILSLSDQKLFKKPCSVEIRSKTGTETASGIASMTDGVVPARLRIVLNGATELSVGSVVEAVVSIVVGDEDQVLSVSESAVVDRGRERLVYVETMPGLFDGVSVELGRRCGAYYPVVKGLKSGQRVASAGAFLIDAETRLNPSLAAGYFGANQNESRSAPPPPVMTAPPASPPAKSRSSKNPVKTLSREDRALVDKQRICPVTELPLNAMGGPVAVVVAGRKVFICCAGCEQRLKDEPEKYFARLTPP